MNVIFSDFAGRVYQDPGIHILKAKLKNEGREYMSNFLVMNENSPPLESGGGKKVNEVMRHEKEKWEDLTLFIIYHGLPLA